MICCFKSGRIVISKYFLKLLWWLTLVSNQPVMKHSLSRIFLIIIVYFCFSACSKSSSGGGGNNGGGGGGGGTSISSISPSSGITGDVITINGSGFSAVATNDTVVINGTKIIPSSATTSAITFNVPTGLGSGNVDLKIGAITTTGPAFTYNTSTVISLYAGGAGQGTLDGALLTGQFNTPRGLTIDMNNNVYVADNYRVRKVDTAGNITTIAGQTTNGYANGAALTTASFEQVMTLACDPAGDMLYIADEGSIRLLTGGNVSTIAGTDLNTGVFYLDATGTAARFNNDFTGLWLDNTASVLYVNDALNGRIRAVTTSGVVTTVAGNGTYGAGGTGTNAAFGNLVALTGDGAGNLFAVQLGGGSIWGLTAAGGTPISGVLRVTYGGAVTTLAGTTSTTGTTDGDTTSATFDAGSLVGGGLTLEITGATYDKTSKILYVAYGENGIRVINLTTGQVSTILPRPDTRTVGVNLINSPTIGPMVEDSKGDLIVGDGFWLYKIAFNQ
jgi:hypothetical protein